MSRRAVPTIVALAVLLTAAPATAEQKPAQAPAADPAAPVAATLQASASEVRFGAEVTLSGTIDPPSGGETVEIRDGDDALIATLITGAAGGFRVTLMPAATTTYRAEWSGLASAPVTVKVRASVARLTLTGVRLFDSAKVSGAIAPSRPGQRVTLSLLRAGRVVATRTPTMGGAGGFSARFPIRDPGTFRVRATFRADDLLKATRVTGARTTPLPTLHEGATSRFVLLLERRLRALHYHLTPANRSFDFRTSDAVMAFRKVQRMPRNHAVSTATWRALAHPKRLNPRSGATGLHIEIDQTRQVVFTVRDGDVEAIIHTSTGKPSTPTYDGTFSVVRKIAGYSAHRLYYPSFFDGNRAIHGWPDVPSYPASHGCARVPYWTAKWIFGLATIGTKVIVYH